MGLGPSAYRQGVLVIDHPHDVFRVPLHETVLEVEALEVADGGGLDDLGQAETFSADNGALCAIKPEQQQLVFNRKVFG